MKSRVTTTFTVSNLLDHINNGTIIINPSWRNRYKWDRIIQEKFIKSINEFVFPFAMIFAKTADNKYECIDGRQRLFSFVDSSDKIKKDIEIPVLIIEYDNDMEKIEHFNSINRPYIPNSLSNISV